MRATVHMVESQAPPILVVFCGYWIDEMPRKVYRYKVYRHKPRSKETMRIRVNRLLKRLLKKQEQKERLRSEGGTGTSYSVKLLQQPTEAMVVEGVIDEIDQSVRTVIDQLQPGRFGESDDDIQFLRGWVRKHNISEASLGELLCILRRSNPRLPADPRTIMQTPGITDVRLPFPGFRTALCDMCGRAFASNRYYKIHIEIVGEAIRSPPCPVCKKTFGNRARLTKHFQILHGGVPVASASVELGSQTETHAVYPA